MHELEIDGRLIGPNHPPFVIAEIGINHGGNVKKAIKMIAAAASKGCECVKIQTHIIEDEMIPNDVIPGNASESIWEIMKRCALNSDEEKKLKEYAESKGLIFLSTPFSRAAVQRLEQMDVSAYKIGSGECNNYPLVELIAKYKKPIIMSTGMNSISSISKSVDIFNKYKTPFALLHCTSIYPTPYDKVGLEAILELRKIFPKIVIGLSDHSISIFPCLGAVSLGASILEKHFTLNKNWPGPDIPISMDPTDLKILIEGSKIIHTSLKGRKQILKEEKPTINFAYACVVAIRDIEEGEVFSEDNIWVKRPGTGEIKAKNFRKVLGQFSNRNIKKNQQIKWEYIAS